MNLRITGNHLYCSSICRKCVYRTPARACSLVRLCHELVTPTSVSMFTEYKTTTWYDGVNETAADAFWSCRQILIAFSIGFVGALMWKHVWRMNTYPCIRLQSVSLSRMHVEKSKWKFCEHIGLIWLIDWLSEWVDKMRRNISPRAPTDTPNRRTLPAVVTQLPSPLI
jgi:hypothetical protein